VGHVEGVLETGFRLLHIRNQQLEQQGALEPIHLGHPPSLPSRGYQRQGFRQDMQPGLGQPRLAVCLGQGDEALGLPQLDSHVLMRRHPLSDLYYACGRVCLHRQHPSPQDAPLLDAVHQALRGGEGHQHVAVGIGGRYVPAAQGKYGGKELCMRQSGRMLQLLGQGQRPLSLQLGLIGRALLPEDLRHPCQVCNSKMMPTTDGGGRERRRIATGETWLQVSPGGHEVATKERDGSHGRLAFQHESC
jgi:hypothetical protein